MINQKTSTMTRSRALVALLGAFLLVSCEENAVQTIDAPELGARIKFFNFGLNAPQVNFYADAEKLSAISSTSGAESVNGVAYGSVSSGGYYNSVAPGAHVLTGKIAALVDKDLTIATQTSTLDEGSAYSFYMSGPYNTTTKVSDSFLIEDDFPTDIDFTVAYVRFVHGVSNAAPLRLWIKNAATPTDSLPVGAEIAYKSAGAFVAVPAAVYNLGARLTGVNTDAISRASISFVAGRVYSISARGDITLATGTNVRFLDNTANR